MRIQSNALKNVLFFISVVVISLVFLGLLGRSAFGQVVNSTGIQFTPTEGGSPVPPAKSGLWMDSSGGFPPVLMYQVANGTSLPLQDPQQVASPPEFPLIGGVWYNVGSGIWQGWNGSVITTFGSGGACPTCLVSTADVVFGYVGDRLITMDLAPAGSVGGNVEIVGGSASNITDDWHYGNGGNVHIAGGDGATGSCSADFAGVGGNGGDVFIDGGNAGVSVACDERIPITTSAGGDIFIGSFGDMSSVIGIGNVGDIELYGASIEIGSFNSSVIFGYNGSSSVTFNSPTTFNSSVSFGANSTILPADKAVSLRWPNQSLLARMGRWHNRDSNRLVSDRVGGNATLTSFSGSDSAGTVGLMHSNFVGNPESNGDADVQRRNVGNCSCLRIKRDFQHTSAVDSFSGHGNTDDDQSGRYPEHQHHFGYYLGSV